MKKKLLIFALFIVAVLGALFLVACNNGGNDNKPEPPEPPTMEKSSFGILYSTEKDGTANYQLSWKAYAAGKFEIVCDDGEPFETEEAKLSLNGFSAGEVHTVTVTAKSAENTQSEPVTVKFKGTKLTMPYNVRIYGDTKSFGWKESEETQVYVISCEKLDLDLQSRPVYTGEIKTIPCYHYQMRIDDLRTIYEWLDLYSLQSFRVRALPYNGNVQIFDYEDDTEIIEFQYPSDFSEQSVNFYAGEMSNPTNVRWDFNGFEDHRGYAHIAWDGALSNYKYKVRTEKITDNPDGMSRAFITGEKGVSDTTFGFDSYTSGEYQVTVQAESDELNYLGEDKNAKSLTYTLYLQQPAEEKLKFRINQTILEAPANIRVEGENIVWDEVEFADNYSVTISGETNHANISSVDTPQLSLQKVFEVFAYRANEEEYEIGVHAYPIENELVSFEDNVPTLNTYGYSRYGTSEEKIKFVSIPTVQNVRVDYENKTVTWDGIEEATGYEVAFRREDGSGRSVSLGSATELDWYRYSFEDFVQMHIVAMCEYNVSTENGVTTMYVPSRYIIEI